MKTREYADELRRILRELKARGRAGDVEDSVQAILALRLRDLQELQEELSDRHLEWWLKMKQAFEDMDFEAQMVHEAKGETWVKEAAGEKRPASGGSGRARPRAERATT